MLLKPLWMTVVSVLTGRKYEKLWWDWEELILELKSTILSTTAWIQISRSIIVNWWNNGRKTTTASKTSLKKLKVRKTLSTANVDEFEGYKSIYFQLTQQCRLAHEVFILVGTSLIFGRYFCVMCEKWRINPNVDTVCSFAVFWSVRGYSCTTAVGHFCDF